MAPLHVAPRPLPALAAPPAPAASGSMARGRRRRRSEDEREQVPKAAGQGVAVEEEKEAVQVVLVDKKTGELLHACVEEFASVLAGQVADQVAEHGGTKHRVDAQLVARAVRTLGFEAVADELDELASKLELAAAAKAKLARGTGSTTAVGRRRKQAKFTEEDAAQQEELFASARRQAKATLRPVHPPLPPPS